VHVAGSAVQVPGGSALDLTAFALPMALDDVARVITQLTGTGVRVRLHGRTAWCESSGRCGGTAGTDGLRVIDPRTGEPAAWRWSWVEVSADSARAASALAVAAVVRGEDAPTRLAGRCRSARLVGFEGTVTLVGRPAAGPAGPRPSLRSTSAA